MPLPSTVHILPSIESDAPELANVQFAALADYNPLYCVFFAIHPLEALPKTIAAANGNPKVHQFKAVETIAGADGKDESRILGFSKWEILDGDPEHGGGGGAVAPPPIDPMKDPEATEDAEPGGKKGNDDLKGLYDPKPHLADLFEEFSGFREKEMDECYSQTVQGRRHLDLKALFVSPEHQRRSIGQGLMQWGLEFADREDIPIFLNSSREAYRLYAKNGFEELGSWELELGHWGRRVEERGREVGYVGGHEGLVERMNGVVDLECCMVRWPKNQKSREI